MSELPPIKDLPTWLAQQFPSGNRRLYANHAAISPWPRYVAETVSAFATENLRDGAIDYSRWLQQTESLRQRAARLIGAAEPRDMALVANTTEGVDIVARGLPWRAGDNIVTAAGEFPTNQMAWARLAERGVALRVVDIRTAADAEQALLDQLDERTRLLTVSAVQWTDGFRLNLGRLGAACRANDTALFVDTIQQLGALAVDVMADQVDFMACGGHKWLHTPEGIGLFYAAPRWRDRLHTGRQGWRMVERPYALDGAPQAEARDARRFEPGTPNMLGQLALDAALSVQEAVGPAVVSRRVLANTERLLAGLNGLRGVRVISRAEPERRSGIVTFQPVNVAPQTLCARLEKAGVIVAPRGGGVRISPHYYQGEAEMEAILGSIEAALDAA